MMKCTCKGDLVVKDGRMVAEGYWRRRKCTYCGKEYTTVEQFCETEKGTVARQAVVKATKPPVIKGVRVKDRPAVDTPSVVLTPVYVPRRESSRTRIEDLKMENENASVFDER